MVFTLSLSALYDCTGAENGVKFDQGVTEMAYELPVGDFEQTIKLIKVSS